MATAKRDLTDPQVQGQQFTMLSVEEVAAWLGVPKTFIYRRTCKGHADPIPSFRFGGHLRFRADEVQDWIENHRNRTDEAVGEAVASVIFSERHSSENRSRKG
ncbi:MAG: helix-turn-helix domain-containing protein [Actinomycetota bacterium]